MTEAINYIDEKINGDREVLNLMPRNGIKKLRDCHIKIEELITEYTNFNEKIFKEITARYNKITEVEEKKEIKELEEQIDELDNLAIESNNKTTYEKMNLDKLMYDINGYYKKDIETTNRDIYESVQSFVKAGIGINADDFTISEYANEYISILLEEEKKGNINSDRMKKAFEELYWKCPEIIYHIYSNIRYLYDQNEKELTKYYTFKTNEMNEHLEKNYSDLNGKKRDLIQQYNVIKNTDEKNILEKFFNHELVLSDYQKENVDALYSKIVKGSEKISDKEKENANENIIRLNENLLEYRKYMEYKFINNEVISIKQKFDKKNKELADAKEKKNKKKKTDIEITKENISNLFAEIFKINKDLEKKDKKTLFGKKMSEREIKNKILERNNKILEIKDKYLSLDELEFKERIGNKIDNTSKISEVLTFASYNYNFLAKTLIKNNNEIVDKEIMEKIKEIRDFVRRYNFSVINYINIGEKKDVSVIIKDMYKLTGFNLNKEDFSEENIEDLIRQTDIIKNYNYILKSSLSLENIDFVINAKEIINK